MQIRNKISTLLFAALFSASQMTWGMQQQEPTIDELKRQVVDLTAQKEQLSLENGELKEQNTIVSNINKVFINELTPKDLNLVNEDKKGQEKLIKDSKQKKILKELKNLNLDLNENELDETKINSLITINKLANAELKNEKLKRPASYLSAFIKTSVKTGLISVITGIPGAILYIFGLVTGKVFGSEKMPNSIQNKVESYNNCKDWVYEKVSGKPAKTYLDLEGKLKHLQEENIWFTSYRKPATDALTTIGIPLLLILGTLKLARKFDVFNNLEGKIPDISGKVTDFADKVWVPFLNSLRNMKKSNPIVRNK